MDQRIELTPRWGLCHACAQIAPRGGRCANCDHGPPPDAALAGCLSVLATLISAPFTFALADHLTGSTVIGVGAAASPIVVAVVVTKIRAALARPRGGGLVTVERAHLDAIAACRVAEERAIRALGGPSSQVAWRTAAAAVREEHRQARRHAEAQREWVRAEVARIREAAAAAPPWAFGRLREVTEKTLRRAEAADDGSSEALAVLTEVETLARELHHGVALAEAAVTIANAAGVELPTTTTFDPYAQADAVLDRIEALHEIEDLATDHDVFGTRNAR